MKRTAEIEACVTRGAIVDVRQKLQAVYRALSVVPYDWATATMHLRTAERIVRSLRARAWRRRKTVR